MIDTIDGIHTTTNPKGTGWANVANGVVLSTHKVKTTALVDARLLAKRHGAKLTIHRRDGSVVKTQAYGVSPIA
jgi:Uncharacterized protein conserved in bacteria (DUF2188)